MLRRRWIQLGLVAITWIALGQVVLFDFVSYDDPWYVTGNPHVKSGLQLEQITWALTTDLTGNWAPLTWWSLMLDAEIFGIDARGFHLTNLILHTFNALLLYAALRALTKQDGPSAFAAALFAVHPLNVEAVAWVSERKELLAACFGLMAIWTYARFVTTRRVRWYVLTCLAFVCSLSSKQMWVTLPCVLLLLDFWPLGRLQGAPADAAPSEDPPSNGGEAEQTSTNGNGAAERATVWRLVGEKIPLFLLTVLFCVAIFAFQRGQGSVQSLAQLSLEARLVNAVTVYAIYIRKMFWPMDLAFFYPHPGATISHWHAALAGAILLAISAGVILLRRRGPFLIVGWLWYLGTLVPVIGLIQVGRQQMADRYTYFPLIGLFIALTWGTCAVVPQHRFRRIILAALGACVLLPAMVLTQRQASHWSESTRLFSHALEVTEDNAFAHTNLGGALQKEGRLTESIAQHEAAIEIDPTEAMYHYNLAFTLVSLERFDEAIERFQKAVEFLPESPLPYFQLGSLYYRRGDATAAAGYLRQALERDPEFAEAHHRLGRLLQRQGDAERAQYHLGQAMQLRPDLFPNERDASP